MVNWQNIRALEERIYADTYEFISKELTYHPELPQFSAEELAARKGDRVLKASEENSASYTINF